MILTCIAQNRFHALQKKGGDIDPKSFSSTCAFTGNVMLKKSKIVLNDAPNFECLNAFEKSIFGGYSSTPFRITFNSGIITDKGISIKLPNENNETISKKVFATILKTDQINQYGYAMTMPLPKAGIKKRNISKLFNIYDLLEKYSLDDKIGHLFKVSINAPTDQLNIDLNTQFCPVFDKKEVLINQLSPYQLFTKKKVGKRGKTLKIQTTKKVISSMGRHTDIYLYAEMLSFLIKKGWKLIEVTEHYTFLQDRYMKEYVTMNQNERKKAKNTVESDASKAMNNHLYGWLLQNSNKPKLKILTDLAKEAEDWMQDRESIGVKISQNPFGSGDYKKSILRKKYDESISNIAGMKSGQSSKNMQKEILDERYEENLLIINQQIEYNKKWHKRKEAVDNDEIL